MVRYSRLHCWRYAKRLMPTNKIVVHKMQGDCVAMIFKLLAESVRQSRKPTHAHSHREVLAFDIACGNIPITRIAGDDRS